MQEVRERKPGGTAQIDWSGLLRGNGAPRAAAGGGGPARCGDSGFSLAPRAAGAAPASPEEPTTDRAPSLRLRSREHPCAHAEEEHRYGGRDSGEPARVIGIHSIPESRPGARARRALEMLIVCGMGRDPNRERESRESKPDSRFSVRWVRLSPPSFRPRGRASWRGSARRIRPSARPRPRHSSCPLRDGHARARPSACLPHCRRAG